MIFAFFLFSRGMARRNSSAHMESLKVDDIIILSLCGKAILAGFYK